MILLIKAGKMAVKCIGSNRKMGDATMDIVLLAMVGVGVYFAWTQISKLLGGSKSAAQSTDNKTVQANTPVATSTSLQAAQSSGQTATLSAATLNSLANTIAAAVLSGPDDPDTGSAAANAAMAVNNAVDWYSLLQAFGTRQDYQNNSVDMVTGLKEVLPAYDVSNLNSFLSDQGIIPAGSSI